MLRIGISGWTYPPWRGVFYPEKWPHRRELEYASRQVNSIEINGTFYSLQKPASFDLWAAHTPDDFVFSIKGGRFITHLKRLRKIETPLANFLASGLLRLGSKLGPILWQFPPNLKFDAELFETFLALLPRDTGSAGEMARKHDSRLNGRAVVDPLLQMPMRHCLEVRNESFMDASFFRLLRKYKAAFVFADSAGKWPYAEDLTSDFVYIRLHGAEELYVSGYTDAALDCWAGRIREWSESRQPLDAKLVLPPPSRQPKVRDIFVYFDNDAKVKAPADARRLWQRLAGSPLQGSDA